MRITTPSEVAQQAGNKYLGVLVAAKFARFLNEFPKDQLGAAGREAHHQGAAGAGRRRAQLQARPPPPLRGVSVWAGRHVVLGVSGGIACYKSCILARRLTEAGAAVDVVLTQGAAEFVRPLTFEALTGRPVLTSLWEPGGRSSHVGWARRPIWSSWRRPPRTSIARAAQGLADDFLTALLLARTAPGAARPRDERRDVRPPADPGEPGARCGARGVALVGPEIGALAEGPSERPGPDERAGDDPRPRRPAAAARRAARAAGASS